jgi:very-short-patch-repair endonuclease
MAKFDSHPKSKFWSVKNTLKPNEVALNSHKKFWFDCGECGHPFDIQLNNVNIGRWCPYCCNKKLCEPNKNCKICFDKCFASVERSNSWSNKNEETPYEVLKNSHKKYWFDCDKCEHEFQSCLSDITSKNSWCPYCANRVMCSSDKNCLTCQNKSFASIERRKNWSSKNKKKPNEVFKSTTEIFIFDCDKCGNEFKSKLSHITDGSWCPNCRYKTEDIVYDKLKDNYPSLQRQFKVDWCKDKKHLPFDFVIEEGKVIIEVDGIAHFKQVAKWKTPEHNRKRDLYKMKCANENGFSIIRILQEDIFKNKYNWLEEIIYNIEKITNENRAQNIYMCKNNEYKDFDIS